MKLFNYVALFIMIVSSPSFAALEECRFIKAKTEREACYDRQSKFLAEKRKPTAANKSPIDPVDQLKIENDRVSRRLRSICRGC
jgi:hypothetical protein